MPSRPRDQARWIVPGVALVAAVLAGYGTRGLWSRTPSAAAAAQPVPVTTAMVVRTDVAQRQVVSGTLGYQRTATVSNAGGGGIITWAAAPGTVIRRGQLLYRLDNLPSVLCYGTVPAWRDIGPGMTPGPDVRELDQNLIALGYDQGGTASDSYDWTTQAAIERWQQAHGLLPTGTIPLGQVAFLPGAFRVTQDTIQPGGQVPAGAAVLQGTSTELAASVNLTPGGPPVRPGDDVLVTLPDGTSTERGAIAAVGTVTTVQGQNGPSAVIPVTIRLARYPGNLDQAPVQVTITEQLDRGVLAVPVTALLAQPGGGYAIRTAGPGRLLPVTTGLYDETTGLIEVSGSGLAAGLDVEVALS